MNRAIHYLLIPKDYGRWLGGLHWSPCRDAIEYEDGGTFAFSQQVVLFLEGLAGSHQPLIPFAHVLHLMRLMGVGGSSLIPPRTREVKRALQTHGLDRLYLEEGRPLRNAGALCAELCRGLAPAVDPPDLAEVVRQAMAGSSIPWIINTNDLAPDIPALSPEEFEAHLIEPLSTFREEDLRHWLRHGRGPIGRAGDDLARVALQQRPRSLDGVLAEAAQRPRLVGAVPMVAQLSGALALPPRRLASRHLPTGGYTDVTTRGLPDRILPSQFALDDLDFVRRLAENELLYFHREEPHQPTVEELLILIDQGVRTWGDVRLILTAAALALGRQAARRKIALRIAATSAPGRILDPLEADPTALGKSLEASDFSPHPGLALEGVLEIDDRAARDVVLLTHPRSLSEPDVIAAARRARPPGRLFAVAVDDGGEVAFSELRHGAPVPLTRFRVTIPPARQPIEPPNPSRDWRGDVEPIGFPFQFGILDPLDQALFDFDYAAERLLVAGKNGLLYSWAVDNSDAEVLPRAMVEGEVLSEVVRIQGVAGGFVVLGLMRSQAIAAHYDWPMRTCTTYSIGDRRSLNHLGESFYIRDLHAVAVKRSGEFLLIDIKNTRLLSLNANEDSFAVNLIKVREQNDTYMFLHIMPHQDETIFKVKSIFLDRGSGSLQLAGTSSDWPAFTPRMNGQPLLKGARIEKAQCRGDVLAIIASGSQGRRLLLFRGPEGTPLGELSIGPDQDTFVLSVDGRKLARHCNDRQVEVRKTGYLGQVLFVTTKGKSHPGLEVFLGPSWMVLKVGTYHNLLTWTDGRFQVRDARADGHEVLSEWLRWQPGMLGGPRRAVSRDTRPRPAVVLYDPQRFQRVAWCGPLNAVVDDCGQVALFDRASVLVAMVFVYRGRVAAWLPDGTRYGPPALTGGPETPGAAEKIGAVLRAVSDQGGLGP